MIFASSTVDPRSSSSFSFSSSFSCRLLRFLGCLHRRGLLLHPGLCGTRTCTGSGTIHLAPGSRGPHPPFTSSPCSSSCQWPSLLSSYVLSLSLSSILFSFLLRSLPVACRSSPRSLVLCLLHPLRVLLLLHVLRLRVFVFLIFLLSRFRGYIEHHTQMKYLSFFGGWAAVASPFPSSFIYNSSYTYKDTHGLFCIHTPRCDASCCLTLAPFVD